MPIRKENAKRYPPEWPEISARIRFERAGGRCECEGECGLNHGGRCEARHGHEHPRTGNRRVTLTCAHLAEPIEDCSDANLKAMCEQCHNRYDAPARAAGVARRREAERQRVLAKAGHLAFEIECATGGRVAR